MKYLLSKNSKSLKPRGNFKLINVTQILTKYFTKLLAFNLVVVFIIGAGACDGQKTKTQPNKSLKTQLDVSGIDATKAFFVTPSGKATNDGSSWQKAMDLQSAIDAAATDAAKKFVLVAQGSYYADPAKSDVTKSFILKNGVKIYGGFDPNSSNLKRYRDASILEGKLSDYANTNQLLKGQRLNNTSILDAFLIQNSSGKINGSGLYLYDNSSPQLKNLTFKNNKTTGYNSKGGAIYMNNSSPHISNSTFINNISDKGDGAAIYSNNSNPKINNSSFSLNSVKDGGKGGAIYNKSSNPSISNCLFSSNLAEFDFGAYSGEGGAIYNDNSKPNISNSVFFKNISNNNGGAIYNNNSKPKIYNSILWNNEKRKSANNWLHQNVFNKDNNSQSDIKYSILDASSVNGENATIDITTGAGKGNNQTPATFAIDKDGKVASASQALIKNKGDNALFLEVYDKIKGNPANTTSTIPSEEKDLDGKARLVGSKIDIGPYEIQN